MMWPHVTRDGLVALQSVDYKGVRTLQPLRLNLAAGGVLTATKGGKGKQQNVPVLQGVAVAVDPFKDLPSVRHGFAVVLRAGPDATQTTAVFSVSERDQLEWVQSIEAALIGNKLCTQPPVELANWPASTDGRGAVVGGGPLGAILGKGSFGVVARGKLLAAGADADVADCAAGGCGGSQGGQDVAIKCLLGGSADENPEELVEFTLEAGLLNQLDHPCILKLHGVALLRAEDVEDIIGSSSSGGGGGGDGDSTAPNMVLAMVCEWCPGGSLQQLLHAVGPNGLVVGPASAPLSQAEKLRLATETVQGLEYLHTSGVVHRDLKPENILLGINNAVKIGDFGQSRRVTLSRTMTANVRGSLLWRAPEMTAGSMMEQMASSSMQRSTQYDTKVDVYSFGIILWEIWTRREPYADIPQIFDIKQGVESGTLRPAGPHDKWPPRVKTLASWCWFRDPDGRPTAEEILAWLFDPNLLNAAAEEDTDEVVGKAEAADGGGAPGDVPDDQAATGGGGGGGGGGGAQQQPGDDDDDDSWQLVPNGESGSDGGGGRKGAETDENRAPPPASIAAAAAAGAGAGAGAVSTSDVPKSPQVLLAQVMERASFEYVAVSDFPAMTIAMRKPPADGGLPIRDRSWLGFSVQNCFEGKELVQWLRQKDPTCSETDANKFGDALQRLGFIRHSVASRKWSKSCFFYWQSSQIVKRLLLLEETRRQQQQRNGRRL